MEKTIELGKIQNLRYCRLRTFRAGDVTGEVVRYRDYFQVTIDGVDNADYMVVDVEVASRHDWSGAAAVGLSKFNAEKENEDEGV